MQKISVAQMGWPSLGVRLHAKPKPICPGIPGVKVSLLESSHYAMVIGNDFFPNGKLRFESLPLQECFLKFISCDKSRKRVVSGAWYMVRKCVRVSAEKKDSLGIHLS